MTLFKSLLFPAVILFLASACSPSKSVSMQEPTLRLYEILKDRDSSKMLKGIVTKEQITQDTAFSWYGTNLKIFKPNTEAMSAVKAKADKISIIIFGGTWCEDTHQLLPKYLSVLEGAQFPEDRLMLVAVDRKKTTIGNLHETFNITNVPTCIIMKDGKEVGRIVEYGKTGLVDKELGDMVAAIQ